MKYLICCIAVCASLFGEDSLDVRIPVVDMQEYYNLETRDAFLDTLFGAMSQVGFFAVRNTGVDTEVIRKAYAEAEAFFRLDLDEKKECFVKELNGQRGFVPGETAKGNGVKDRKEFYHVGREGSFAPNVWPQKGELRGALTTLYDELERYVVPLQEAIITTINRKANTEIALDRLNRETLRGDSLLRALYYPKLSKEEIEGLHGPLFWAAAHTDIDLLAILPYATEKGLQVEIDGKWLNVVVPSDAFVVNVGDMLENLTNGLFVSAKHRVVAQEPEKDRFSMVFFVHPTDDTPLDPIEECIVLSGGKQLYAPGTRKEFLWERLLELNIAPALLEPYSKTGHVERQFQFGRQSPQVVEALIKQGYKFLDRE